MSAKLRGTVLVAVLGTACGVLITACGSNGGVQEGLRRQERAAREAGAGEFDDSFWTTGAAARDDGGREPAGGVASSGSERSGRLAGLEEGLFSEDEVGMLEELPEEGLLEEEPMDLEEEPVEPEVARSPGSSDAERIFDEMTLDAQDRLEEARWWAAQGDDAFERQLYEEAKKYYRNSLDLDPDNPRVRDRWNDTLTFLNERGGERNTLADEYIRREAVRRDQNRTEIRRNLTLGREALAEGKVDEAERHIRLALDTMDVSPDLVGPEKRSEAKRLLREIESRKAEEIARERLERQRQVEEEVLEQLAEEDLRGRRQVQDLLRKAQRQIKVEDYHKAVETCESVLELDPGNRVAMFWRATSREQLLKLEQLRMIQEREENRKDLDLGFVKGGTAQEAVRFPSAEEWADVQGRHEAFDRDFEEPESVRRMRQALSRPINTSFENTPLSDVIQTFRTFSGVNMFISSQVEAEETLITQQVTNLPIISALRGILDSQNLSFNFDSEAETVRITPADELGGGNNLFKVYNVSDLLTKVRDFQAPEIRLRAAGDAASEAPISFVSATAEEGEQLDDQALIELIRNSTGGDDSWVSGTEIQFNRGQLFITAPRELHLDVQRVLESLRQDSDLFVVIEARFIDVFDDFLEDIGIDARGLGLVNNLGTPFGNVINNNATGGNDLGIVQQGDLDDISLVQGLDRWAGRVQHIIDGFSGTIRGDRLNANNGLSGATFQATWLEPFQVNVILRMVQEKQDVRQLTAPIVTAHNNERVYVSVITQRAYIADYELVSGGVGFTIIEVADPVVQTFQEGVILDVDPTISHDKKYVTLDVRPTLATLIGGVISTLNISLGSFSNVAFQVPIGIPQIALQQSFTSVTVPNGGTVLLGGFKSMDERKFTSYLPIVGKIPILKNLARRRAVIDEKRSLVILLTARIVDLRGQEERLFNRG